MNNKPIKETSNEPELEDRLNRLIHEIHELRSSAEDIDIAINRLGTPNLPEEAVGNSTRQEPETFLERLDQQLDDLTYIQDWVKMSAERLKNTV